MLESVSADLESSAKYVVSKTEFFKKYLKLNIIFDRYTRRSTVYTNDVMILSRRNEGLEALLKNTKRKSESPVGFDFDAP